MALFLILFLFCAATTSLPIEDEDVVIISDEFLSSNRIEGDGEIDVSDLGPQAYGVPKNESGAALSEWTDSSLMNPEEMGGYLEGDILIPGLARNGMRDKTSRWTNGIIPYIIDGSFTQEQKDTIRMAIADYHRLTCLRFVPYSGQSDYIIIKSSKTGCWSSVGRLGGRQEVNLQAPGCVSKKGTVLHELLHAIGFMHEQSRPERDDFVTIHYENVKPGTEINFKKSDVKRTDNFGIGYDYNSVMHYSEFAFSRNSKKTIDPKVSNTKIGQREGLSRGDVKKVNNMYNCKKDAPPSSEGIVEKSTEKPQNSSPTREPQTGWLGSIWQSFFGDKKSDSDVVVL